MTASTNPGADFLAVHSVDEFVVSVPDLEQARHFYTSFGLDVRDEGGALALYTFGHPHRWARVRKGGPGSQSKHLDWISLGIHAADDARFRQHLASKGIASIAPPPGADDDGLWIEGPDALPIHLRVAEKSSPSQAAPREFPPANNNAGRSPNRSEAQPTLPLYLPHILLFSADVDARNVSMTLLHKRH